MADESFREIQLSGKQLIALFMTAAVVLIATFLAGVQVGRGVRSQREPAAATDAAQPGGAVVDPTATPAATKAPSPPEPQVQAPPPAAPPPQVDEVPLPNARGDARPAPAATAPAAGPGGSPKPTEVKPKEAPAPAAAPVSGEPAGNGYFVKVVAYNTKAQADKVAAGLSAKGYSTTYVVPVPGKARTLYSVRVGKFATSAEADAVKRRLEQEQYKPSIAR